MNISGHNVESYVDDVVVKTKDPSTLIADLKQTFDNLREYKWKLNPSVCLEFLLDNYWVSSLAIGVSKLARNRFEQSLK